MAISTYAELVAAITTHLADDLQGQVDNFITLAEASHKRDIRVRAMKKTATLTLAQNATTVALPADFLDLHYLRLNAPTGHTGRKYWEFDQVDLGYIEENAITHACRPRYFSFEDSIETNAPADIAYTLTLTYYAPFTPLQMTNPASTNWLLQNAPDAYLYGALAATALYLHQDERLQTWVGLYRAAVDGLNANAQKNQYGAGAIVPRPQAGRVFPSSRRFNHRRSY
ncbi:MAG: hypothetical protein AAF529_20200 [Pseudomonadota bacterium]